MKPLLILVNDQRKAVVSESGGGYLIDMFEEQELILSRQIDNHTQQYAEDCAENWVTKVIK